MAMNLARRRRRRRAEQHHQHHAAGGRDAGAADHLPDHHPGGHADDQLQLPKERNLPTQTKPENIVIAVNRDGEVFWGIERCPTSRRWSTG
jgi:hypothetical protein